MTARRVPTIAYLGTHITERRVVFLGGSARAIGPSGPTRDLAPRDLVSGPSGRAKHGCRPLRWLRRARALTGKLLHAVMSGAASRDPALLRRRANQICFVTRHGTGVPSVCFFALLTRKPNTMETGCENLLWTRPARSVVSFSGPASAARGHHASRHRSTTQRSALVLCGRAGG